MCTQVNRHIIFATCTVWWWLYFYVVVVMVCGGCIYVVVVAVQGRFVAGAQATIHPEEHSLR